MNGDSARNLGPDTPPHLVLVRRGSTLSRLSFCGIVQSYVCPKVSGFMAMFMRCFGDVGDDLHRGIDLYMEIDLYLYLYLCLHLPNHLCIYAYKHTDHAIIDSRTIPQKLFGATYVAPKSERGPSDETMIARSVCGFIYIKISTQFLGYK